MTKHDRITLLGFVALSVLIVGLSILFAFLTESGVFGIPVFLIAFSICGFIGFASGGRR